MEARERGGLPYHQIFLDLHCKVWRKSLASQSHFATKLCRDLTSKRQATERAAHQAEEVNRSPFKHKGTALTKVSQFPYLGRTLMVTNNGATQHGKGQEEVGGDAEDLGHQRPLSVSTRQW